ncbi:MAG: methyl-accepting chemotaxis protein [Spirochaetaceae bacterium]
MKLWKKSFITNLIAPLIIFIGVMIFTFMQIASYKIDDVSKTQVAVLHAASSDIKATLNHFATILKIGSNIESFKNMMMIMPQDHIEEELNLLPDYNSAVKNLKELTKNNNLIDIIYFTSKNSPILVSQNWANIPPDYDARQRGWYKGAQELKDIFITEPYITADAAVGNKLTTTMSYPIMENGKFEGVIAMDMSIQGVTDEIDNVQKLHPELSITLFNGENQQVLYNQSTSFEDNVFVSDLFEPLGYTEAMQKDFLEMFSRVSTSGKPEKFDAHRVVSLFKVDGTPWLIAAAFTKRELLAKNLSTTFYLFLISTIVFISVLIFGFIISKIFIFKPMEDLSDKFYDISHGEGDLTVRVDRKTNDELGLLARNFNSFTEKIRLMMVTVKDATSSIDEKQNNVTSVTKETAEASTEISTNVVTVNGQIEDLNGQLQSVSSAMDQIAASVTSLFENTNTQTKAVDEASSSIEEMVAQLESVAKIINEKKSEAEKLTHVINESGKQISDATAANEEVVELAGKVSDMSEVISSIASQTNLLSMNAAIEAAHAGDAGKGFAVVADEIRKLAEVAQDSSSEIQETITNILNKVDIAYKISRESENTFQKLREGTQSTITALEDINVSTQELTQGGALIISANAELSHVSIQVRQSAEEMSDTISLVTESTRAAADISTHVKESMSGITHGTNHITSTVKSINDLAAEVSANADLLTTETNKFKT